MNAGTLISLVAAVAATSAHALSVDACAGEESGMAVSNGRPFGFSESGYVVEDYRNLDRDGIPAGEVGPIPVLNHFIGTRIIDCRTGRFLALDGVFDDPNLVLTATEFLREKTQAEKAFSLSDVEQAARAVYHKDGSVRYLTLRETEETCACGEYFPGVWK